MGRTLLSTALAAVLFASAGFAQGYYGRYDRDREYRDGYRGRDGFDFINRVRADLERGASSSFYAHNQRGRFDHALRELNKFEDRLQRGRFDKGPLDEVISETSHLSRSRELDPRLRDMLARDANELREFRYNGGYDYNYGRRW